MLVHSFLRARHMSQPAQRAFEAIIEAVRRLSLNGDLPPDP